MLDEGVAREIINRVQKLRKKAGLLPTDDVVIHYEATPQGCEIDRVAQSHREYIENTLKMPYKTLSQLKENAEEITKEKIKVKGKIIINLTNGCRQLTTTNSNFFNLQ